MSNCETKWSVREVALVVGLVLATLLVRFIVLQRVFIVSRDAMGFLQMAQAFAAGDVGSMLAHPQHPFYPFLVVCARLGIGDWITAGQAVSLVMGVLGVIPLYLLTREAFSQGVALIAGMLFAFSCSAVPQSVDILTEPTYVTLCLGALYLGWRAATRASIASAALMALVAGLAYLTRPEGGGVFLIGVGAILVGLLGCRRSRVSDRVVSLLLAVVIFAVTIGPYLVVLRTQTGDWRLTKKKKLHEFFDADRLRQEELRGTEHERNPLLPPAEVQPSRKEVAKYKLRRAAQAAYQSFRELGESAHWLVLALAIWGVIRAKTRRRGEWVFAAAVILYIAVVFMAARLTGYVARRHMELVAVLILPWAGRGIIELARFAGARCADPAACRRRQEIAWRAILAGVLVVVSFKTFLPCGEDKAGFATAGRRILDTFGPGKRLAHFSDGRIALYARGTGQDLAGDALKTADDLCEALRRGGSDFFVADLSEIGDFLPGVTRENLDARLDPVLTESKVWQAADGEVVVYRVAAPCASAPASGDAR